MRSFLVGLALPFVNGCEYVYYSDSECKEESLEVKRKTNDVEYKTTYSARMAWVPGRCMKFGEPIEVKTEMGGVSVKQEHAASFGVAGIGQAGGYYYTFGTDNADGDNACAYSAKKNAEKTASDPTQTKYFMSGSGGTGTNICQPDQTMSDLPIDKREKRESKDAGAKKMFCGPAPASVWGIILGSLGIVLALAGIGLAAAGGK